MPFGPITVVPVVNELARIVEALLFLSPEPVSVERLADACEVGEGEIVEALARLREHYAEGFRGVVLREVAGGFTLATDPVAERAARRLLARPRTPPLTQAQAECLAIVAYLQPVSRPGDRAHPRRRLRVGRRHAARARADRGVRPLALRRGPLPHDRAVREAVRPLRARRAARPGRVRPDARGGGRAARAPAPRGRARARRPPRLAERVPASAAPRRRSSAGGASRRSSGSSRSVALTFDDGPGPGRDAAGALDALDGAGAHGHLLPRRRAGRGAPGARRARIAAARPRRRTARLPARRARRARRGRASRPGARRRRDRDGDRREPRLFRPPYGRFSEQSYAACLRARR